MLHPIATFEHLHPNGFPHVASDACNCLKFFTTRGWAFATEADHAGNQGLSAPYAGDDYSV